MTNYLRTWKPENKCCFSWSESARGWSYQASSCPCILPVKLCFKFCAREMDSRTGDSVTSSAYNILPSPESVGGGSGQHPLAHCLTGPQYLACLPVYYCYLFFVCCNLRASEQIRDFLQTESTGNSWTVGVHTISALQLLVCAGAVWSAPTETRPALAWLQAVHTSLASGTVLDFGAHQAVRISMMRKRKISFFIGHSLSFLEGHPREKKSKLTAWLNPLVNRKPS